jgi:hypothetical protein
LNPSSFYFEYQAKKIGLLVTCPLFISTLFISFRTIVQNTLRIDLFSQPDDSSLNYFGSRDVFMDNQFTTDEIAMLGSLLEGILSC